ncbi:unnamed protein product [Lota lota]
MVLSAARAEGQTVRGSLGGVLQATLIGPLEKPTGGGHQLIRLERAPPVVRSADRTTLCRALLSLWVLLPHQAVMLPVRRNSKEEIVVLTPAGHVLHRLQVSLPIDLETRPTTAVSSANLMMVMELKVATQSCVDGI